MNGDIGDEQQFEVTINTIMDINTGLVLAPVAPHDDMFCMIHTLMQKS